MTRKINGTSALRIFSQECKNGELAACIYVASTISSVNKSKFASDVEKKLTYKCRENDDKAKYCGDLLKWFTLAKKHHNAKNLFIEMHQYKTGFPNDIQWSPDYQSIRKYEWYKELF